MLVELRIGAAPGWAKRAHLLAQSPSEPRVAREESLAVDGTVCAAEGRHPSCGRSGSDGTAGGRGSPPTSTRREAAEDRDHVLQRCGSRWRHRVSVSHRPAPLSRIGSVPSPTCTQPTQRTRRAPTAVVDRFRWRWSRGHTCSSDPLTRSAPARASSAPGQARRGRSSCRARAGRSCLMLHTTSRGTLAAAWRAGPSGRCRSSSRDSV